MLVWKRIVGIVSLLLLMATFSYAESFNSAEYKGLALQEGDTVSDTAHKLVGRKGNEWREKYVVIKRLLADGSYRTIPKSSANNVQVGDMVFVHKSVIKNQHQLEVVNQSLTHVCEQYQIGKSECLRIARRNDVKNLNAELNLVLYWSSPFSKPEVTYTEPLTPNSATTTVASPQPSVAPTIYPSPQTTPPGLQEQTEASAFRLTIAITIIFIIIAIILITALRRNNFAMKSINPRNFTRLKKFREELVNKIHLNDDFDAAEFIRHDRWKSRLYFACKSEDYPAFISVVKKALPSFSAAGLSLHEQSDYSDSQKVIRHGYIYCKDLHRWNPKLMSLADLTVLNNDLSSVMKKRLEEVLPPLGVTHAGHPASGSKSDRMLFVAEPVMDYAIDRHKVTLTLNFQPGKELAPGDEKEIGERLAVAGQFGKLDLKNFRSSRNGQQIQFNYRYLPLESLVEETNEGYS